MSSVVAFNTVTGSVEVFETGLPGPAGLVWQDGGWLPDTRYQRNWALYHDGTSYRALVEHVSTAETEPGVGADWETAWQALALGSDVEDVETVAGIAAEIVAVASIKDDVETLAPVAPAIQEAADNMQAILAAPGAASDAADARDLAQAWAENPEDSEVEPGQYSARHYAAKAAASAAMERSGIAVYHDTAIETGGYIADISARIDSVQTTLHAELLGDGEADFYVSVAGEMAYGPLTVAAGSPVSLSSLSIPVDATDQVAFIVTFLTGSPTDLLISMHGEAA